MHAKNFQTVTTRGLYEPRFSTISARDRIQSRPRYNCMLIIREAKLIQEIRFSPNESDKELSRSLWSDYLHFIDLNWSFLSLLITWDCMLCIYRLKFSRAILGSRMPNLSCPFVIIGAGCLSSRYTARTLACRVVHQICTIERPKKFKWTVIRVRCSSH